MIRLERVYKNNIIRKIDNVRCLYADALYRLRLQNLNPLCILSRQWHDKEATNA